ncbi:hypothetical protein FO519_007541 [Halicephalobus sp. NKZ332]|nr:hypothetical protein FO519_007541 [Halicephalobus sp. NKZ332]
MSRVLLFLVSSLVIGFVQANFEDSRCRCTCPSTRYFVENSTEFSENQRRYYTKTNLDPSFCNPQNVVKQTVIDIVDNAHMDAFLANCDCRYESRNTVLLKVVVIFVICVLFVLGTYMGFLIVLDPMMKRQRSQVGYSRQDDELEENIFADPRFENSDSMQMRPRTQATNVLSRVEEEQNKWKSTVEEQRRKVMTDHTMLN